MNVLNPVIPGRPAGPNPEPTTGRALSDEPSLITIRVEAAYPVVGSGFFAARSPGKTEGAP